MSSYILRVCLHHWNSVGIILFSRKIFYFQFWKKQWIREIFCKIFRQSFFSKNQVKKIVFLLFVSSLFMHPWHIEKERGMSSSWKNAFKNLKRGFCACTNCNFWILLKIYRPSLTMEVWQRRRYIFFFCLIFLFI